MYSPPLTFSTRGRGGGKPGDEARRNSVPKIVFILHESGLLVCTNSGCRLTIHSVVNAQNRPVYHSRLRRPNLFNFLASVVVQLVSCLDLGFRV